MITVGTTTLVLLADAGDDVLYFILRMADLVLDLCFTARLVPLDVDDILHSEQTRAIQRSATTL